jgi:hypothetical protein
LLDLLFQLQPTPLMTPLMPLLMPLLMPPPPQMPRSWLQKPLPR